LRIVLNKTFYHKECICKEKLIYKNYSILRNNIILVNCIYLHAAYNNLNTLILISRKILNFRDASKENLVEKSVPQKSGI